MPIKAPLALIRLSAVMLALGLSLTACNGANEKPSPPSTPTSPHTFRLEPFAEGLEFPWGMAFLPNGDLLVTERPGRLRLIKNGRLQPEPIAGVPAVLNKGQGGLFDVAIDPDFATNRRIYLAFAKGAYASNATAVARAELSNDASRLENVQIIFEATFKKQATAHFGGRLGFLPDGSLLLTLGDGFRYMHEAQNTKTHLGAIIRINTNGSVPADNPLINQPDALPEIYSYGHRNVQGLAIDGAANVIYSHEHGPKGGDEVNIIEPGRNYGWPLITYGVNYDGAIISSKTHMKGMEQPIVKWSPSIAPSGMAIYRGPEFSDWNGDLLVTALAGQQIRRIDMEDGKVASEEIVMHADYRLRDIIVDALGAVFVAVDDSEGGVYRLVKEASQLTSE